MPQNRHRARTNADQLLRTKLMPPRIPAALVARPSLLARLDKGMTAKLTLVSAPPGYGKTTLVTQWLATRGDPWAWVALDPGDDDPVRFWTYVITACRALDPALGKIALADLRTVRRPSFEALLTSFINELADLATPGILVLEDYHVITSPQIHAGVAFLLDHLPDTLHLVLLTRSEPPLHLARLRARNQVADIGAADLQFSREESHDFIAQHLGVALKPETVARLEAKTEGWAAGLRLISLALEGNRDPSSMEQRLGAFSRGHQQVAEYLMAEVLSGQPEPIQEFLLQTSILNRLTASLCDAVTARSDSAGLLAQLERSNLFVVRLGESGDRACYRYRGLFAEAMRVAARERYGEEGLRSLYSRASEWYEAHGVLDEAIEAALAGQQSERAAVVIERSFERRGEHELYTLRRWAEQIPREVLQAHPAVCFEYAIALLFTSDRYAATTAAQLETPLRFAENSWRREENLAGLGRVLALRALVSLWQGDLARASSLAADSLQLLPEDDVFWRGSDLIIVGIDETLAGRMDTAQNILIEARALSGAAQNIQGQLAATGLLADVYTRQGEFDQAALLYEKVRAEAVGGDDMLDDQGTASLGLGTIAYERNDLNAAEREATRAYEMGTRRSNEMLAVQAALVLARVLHARGSTDQAQERLRLLIAQTRHPYFVRQFLAYQARLALAAGDVEAAHRWHVAVAQHADDLPLSFQEQQDMVLARMWIAGREFPAALELLERWRADARQHGRTSSELEILVLEAQAYRAQSDDEQASKTLFRALTIAQSKGYLRTFLDEGEPMRLLISDFRSRIVKKAARLRAFTYKLLSAFSAPILASVPKSLARRPAGTPDGRTTADTPRRAEIRNLKSQILFEPLSPQEQRVLRLLAAGLSNPEIARELVVSTNTIKTQLQSIYRKLNVDNREQAREVARDLNLL